MISRRFSSAARAVAVVCALCAGLAYAYAREVSSAEARLAVTAWARSGRTLQDGASVTAVSAARHVTTNGTPFYAVKLADGGTVFATGLTTLEPVVAFTSSTNDFATLDTASPLWQLLNRDISVRAAYAALANRPVLSAATASARAAAAASTAPAAAATRASGAWEKLLAAASDPALAQAIRSAASAASPATGAHPNNFKTTPSDLRVPILVKSKWSQTSGGGGYCYNYHTPDHDPCGCTATAAAQIMRYWEYPKTEVAQMKRTCTVDGTSRSLTTIGGTYDWDLMTLVPGNSGCSDAQREMIGRLCSDVGILLTSDYTTAGTSSVAYRVPPMLKDALGYASAMAYYDTAAWNNIRDDGKGTSGGLHTAAMRQKTILASLDAGSPVELGIYGFENGNYGDFKNSWAGHAVVGDGYGYATYDDAPVCYVHINLGWAGQDDAWYNIPEINSASTGAYVGGSGIDFTVMGMVVYNIFPEASGQILSGRVFDDAEKGLEAATVTLYASGTENIVATTNTSAQGIYAFVVPGDTTYDIRVEKDGLQGDLENVFLKMDAPDATEGYVTEEAGVGNSWGNDIELSEPNVTNLTQSVAYTSLDKALADVAEGDALAVIRPTRLRKSVTVPQSCTVSVAPADPSVQPVVRCSDGAVVTVAGGANLQLFDVAFTNACAGFAVEGRVSFVRVAFAGEAPAVSVAEAGEVRFEQVTVGGSAGTLTVAPEGYVGFDRVTVAGEATADWAVAGRLDLEGSQLGTNQTVTVAATNVANVTIKGGVTHLARLTFEEAKREALTLAGALTEPIDVVTPGAATRGAVFGSFTCDYPTAAANALFFVNALDEEGDLGGKAVSEEDTLVWDIVNWAREQAVCYTAITGTSGVTTNYYRKLNSLLKYTYGTAEDPRTDAPTDVEAVIYETGDGAMTLRDFFLPTGSLTLRAETAGAPFTVTVQPGSGFRLDDAASLTVRDIVFDGAGATFAEQTPGAGDASLFQVQGGALAFEAGAVVTNATFDGRSGAVEVYGGAFTMKSGSAIGSCRIDPTDYEGPYYGGAVDVITGTFDMQGGTISDCSVLYAQRGGGVYVWSAWYEAVMKVSGDAVVTGCASGESASSQTADNVTWQTNAEGSFGLELAGAFTGSVGVTALDEEAEAAASSNDTFAVVAEALRNDPNLPAYAACFVNDRNAGEFVGTNAADRATLVWTGRLFTYKRAADDPAVTIRIIDATGATNYYYTINEAFAEVTGPVTAEVCRAFQMTDAQPLPFPFGTVCGLPGHSAMTNDVTIAWPTVLRCAEGVNAFEYFDVLDGRDVTIGQECIGPFRRDARARFIVTSELTVTNLFLDGGSYSVTTLYRDAMGYFAYEDEIDVGVYGNFIEVNGGTLTLENGTYVANSSGDANRGDGMITVYNGGRVVSRGQVDLRYGENVYAGEGTGRAQGGAILADINAAVSLDGCWICGCLAADGAGIHLANGSSLTLAGDTRVFNNWAWTPDEADGYTYATNNVTVADDASRIFISAPVTNANGVTHGFGVFETNVFAYVPAETLSAETDAAAVSNLAASAVFFTNDVTAACGVMLTNAAGRAVFAWWDPAKTNALSANRMVFDWQHPDEKAASAWNQVTDPSLVDPSLPSDPEPGPGPTPPPSPVSPTPIAFKSVTKNAEGQWELVLTNTVSGCSYRLLSTADLSKGFTTTGAWHAAESDGPWTNKVDATAGASFWKAEAKGSEE